MPVQGTIVDLTVPFEGERDFFSCGPGTWETAPPHATIEEKQLYTASIALGKVWRRERNWIPTFSGSGPAPFGSRQGF